MGLPSVWAAIPAMTIRTISYGGGVQSSAMLVLAAQGKLDEIMGGKIDAALFANTGDDSEHPKTLQYVREVMTPWAAKHGIEVVELHRTMKSGETETLWQRATDPNKKSLPIPVRLSNGAPASRHCTVDFKIKVLQKWIKSHGATAEDPACVAVGISTDEYQRANNKSDAKFEKRVFPLLHLGLSRGDCMNLIKDAGLPVPHKSSCFFCPWHSKMTWAEMRRDEPELFEKSVELERILHEKADRFGHKRAYMTDVLVPLEEAIMEAPESLFAEFNGGKCDSGFCWT
jgi:3'-phosphoadenosine 5'-phosphosulfate sulfotransferase (PAPS reductase)/FAD synthetase